LPIGLQFVEVYAGAAVIADAFVFEEDELEDPELLELEPQPERPSAATPAVAAVPATKVRRVI
jgi:hypothetical protein